ncbi:hypothetical protein F4779DRAFT_612637 [Xylariaceae sp. FL0662B]|nr:hypothetical protein F4779DRAFT_612637 [Xylariaceae sp. FL0662B]
MLWHQHLAHLVLLGGTIPSIASSAPTGNEVDYGSLECPQSPNETLPTPTCGTPTPDIPLHFFHGNGTSGAIFGICTTEVIDAPAAAVYAALLDFASYGRWNTFIVDVSLLLLPSTKDVSTTPADDVYVGMPMRFTSRGLVDGVDTTSVEVISGIEGPGAGDVAGEGDGEGNRGYLLASWRYDDGLGGLGSRSEHPSVLVDLGNGSTRYLSYETYYAGLESGAVALLKDNLQRQFEAQGRDLKAYVENMLVLYSI